jgi:hypothetical protein
LDRGRGDVALLGERAGDRLYEAEVVKRVQSGIFLHEANRPPRHGQGVRGARGLGHPAWPGLSVFRKSEQQAENRSADFLHAACGRPDVLSGPASDAPYMAYSCGHFKATGGPGAILP